MKTKALVLGALPVASEGPWVRIDDEKEWWVTPRQDYNKAVKVEVLTGDSPSDSYPLNGVPLTISGERARVVITSEIVETEVSIVTVQLHAKR